MRRLRINERMKLEPERKFDMLVPHQITIIAFQTNEDGTQSVYDIIETSFHHASFFARQFIRDKNVSSFEVCAPNAIHGRKWKKIVR